jgi:hypothetical protein
MAATDDPGGHLRVKAMHRRAAGTHSRAAALHEESASLHDEHASEMRDKGLHASAARAERIADHERALAVEERGRADKHRRSAENEPD